jgi:Yip1-like protein
MNEPTNTPMLPPPSGVSEWVRVWRDALTRPSDETFARIGQSPNAKSTTAFLWVFLGSLVSSLLALPVQGVLMRQMLQSMGLEDQGFPTAGGGLMTVICGAPIGAVVAVVLFAIVVGIVQLLARMFGGRGTFDQLAYAIAAIVTPFYLVSGVLGLLSAIPFAGLCFGLLGFAAALYVLVLEVMAVKGVNQFGWGQAIGSLLLPVLAVACCISVAIGALLSMASPELMDIFNSITTPAP